MAQNWVNINSTIGTSSRNFIDPTTWNAALPSDLRTGGGVNHVGLMFADSDFTDVNLTLGPVTATNMTRACSVKLVNAPGEKPIWKPGVGTAVSAFVSVLRGMTVAGIIFDGDDRDVLNTSTGLVAARGEGPVASGPIILRCILKNSSGAGMRINTDNPEQATIAFCLAYDNVSNGFHSTANANNATGTLVHCGSAFNGGWGYGSGDTSVTWNIRGSWALDNTSGDIEIIKTGTSETVHNVISDGSFTTLGLTLDGTEGADILESATLSQFAFTDVLKSDLTKRDFTPGTGSVLLGKAAEFGSNNAPPFTLDLNGNLITLNSGDRFDVGPIQSSVPDITPPAKITDLVII